MSSQSKRVPINSSANNNNNVAHSPDSSANHLFAPGAAGNGKSGSNLAFSPSMSASGLGGNRNNSTSINSPSLRAAAMTALGYRGTEQGDSDEDEDNEVRIDVNQVARKLNIPVHAISRKIRDATEGGVGEEDGVVASPPKGGMKGANVGSYKAPTTGFMDRLTGNTNSANNRKKPSQIDDETNARLISDDVMEGILTEEVVPSFRVRRALGAGGANNQQRPSTSQAIPIAPSREGSPSLRPAEAKSLSKSIQRSRPQSLAMNRGQPSDLRPIASGAYEVDSDENNENKMRNQVSTGDGDYEGGDALYDDEEQAQNTSNSKLKKSTFSFVQNVKQRHFKLVRAGANNTANQNNTTDDEDRHSGSEAGPKSLGRNKSGLATSFQSQGMRGGSPSLNPTGGKGGTRGATYMAVQASDEEESGGDDVTNETSSSHRKRAKKSGKKTKQQRNHSNINETGSFDGDDAIDGDGSSTDGSASTYSNGAPKMGPSSPSANNRSFQHRQLAANGLGAPSKSSDYDSSEGANQSALNGRPSTLSQQRRASHMAAQEDSIDVNVIEDGERRAQKLAKIDAELQKGLKEGKGKNHDAVTFLSLTQEKSGDIFVSMKRQSATLMSKRDEDEGAEEDENEGRPKTDGEGDTRDTQNYYDDGATLGSPSGPLLKGAGKGKKKDGPKRQVHFPDNIIKKVDFVQESRSKVVMRVEYNRPVLAYLGAVLAMILQAVSWCMVGKASFAPFDTSDSNTTAVPTTTTAPPVPSFAATLLNSSSASHLLKDASGSHSQDPPNTAGPDHNNGQTATELARSVALVLFFAYAVTALIHLLLTIMRRSPTKLEKLSFQHPHHMKKLGVCVVSGSLGLVAKAGSFMLNISSLNLVFFTVWPLIFSYLWHVGKERNFSFVDIGGMLLAIIGTVVLIVGAALRETEENEHTSTRAASAFVAVLAAALETISWNYEKQARRYFSNAIVVLITSSLAMLAVLGVAIALGSFTEPFGPNQVSFLQQDYITARWIVGAAGLMGIAICLVHSTAVYFDTISIMGLLSLSGVLSVLLYQAFDSLPLIETAFRAAGSGVVGIGCIILIVSSFVSRRHVELVFALPKSQVKRKSKQQQQLETIYEDSSPETAAIGTPDLKNVEQLRLDGSHSGGGAAAEFLRKKKNNANGNGGVSFGSNDDQPAPLVLSPSSGNINGDDSDPAGTHKPSLLVALPPQDVLVTAEPSRHPQFPSASFDEGYHNERQPSPSAAGQAALSSSPPMSPTGTEAPETRTSRAAADTDGTNFVDGPSDSRRESHLEEHQSLEVIKEDQQQGGNSKRSNAAKRRK